MSAKAPEETSAIPQPTLLDLMTAVSGLTQENELALVAVLEMVRSAELSLRDPESGARRASDRPRKSLSRRRGRA